MGRKGDARVFEFVDAAMSIGVRALTKRLGAGEDVAGEVMREIIHDLCSTWGRQQMYVPAVLEIGRTGRDERIWAAYSDPAGAAGRPFSHERITAVAAAEGLSVRQVYSIVALVRQRLDEERHRDLLKRQGSLPGLGPNPES